MDSKTSVSGGEKGGGEGMVKGKGCGSRKKQEKKWHVAAGGNEVESRAQSAL